ncbi:MAG: O-linked N-acetylglucosamine transferase, SPINDLY family protein [Pyrinomonadaceae bacterium]
MSPHTSDAALKMEEIARRRLLETEQLAKENRERILAEARAAVKANDRDPNTYIAAARSCKQLGELYEALEILRRGIERCDPAPQLHEYYVERLEKCNRTEEAIAAASEAARLFPDELIFRLREALLLPVFYDSQHEIEHYRTRFTAGLHRLIAEVPLETNLDKQRALAAIGKHSNKYLPYQGQNDRELQTLYGGWIHAIMAANFPQLAQPIPLPAVAGKIRIGYLSSQATRFIGTSAEKLFGAWIREHDREQFEVFAYHADRHADVTYEQVHHWNINFRQFSGDVAEIAQAIRADQLHVLVYLDFGIHPRMAQLAALRLAPIQCVVWDSPLTSGVPTMDYFLSSDLMEPQGAQDHYSEKLVPLPGVGVCLPKPVIPKVILTKTRRDFGLRDDAVLYLSCQSIFKYLPEQDNLIAQIAMRLPNSQFVFLTTNEIVKADFVSRMDCAFAAVNLRAADYCVWLSEMALLDFWNLHLIADVALDPVGWSGGVTTFEAIACGLPVVTLPGTLMRARHSYAILKQLGVTDTIASDATEYVELAARLGRNMQLRQSVIDRMVAGYPGLYSDMRSVRALEDFYRRATEQTSFSLE